MGLIAVQCCSLLIFTQKDTPALAAPFESAKQGVHFAAKITTPHWNFATKKREKPHYCWIKSQACVSNFPSRKP